LLLSALFLKVQEEKGSSGFSAMKKARSPGLYSLCRQFQARFILEAKSGFEPLYKVLQTSA
jgi:hypothetical protein